MVGTRCSPTCSTGTSPLALQLLLQLIEEAPVSTLSNDLLGTNFNHSSLMQAQGVEAHGIFWIILAPPVVGNVLHRLEGIVIDVALVRDQSRGAVGLQGTEVGRFHNSAQRPFGRHRVLADEISISAHNAAEILGPGPVQTAVDDQMADPPRPQLLGHWRKAD